MLEFVICDDNEMVLKNLQNVVIKYMGNRKYVIKKYNDYDNKFINIINSAENRIYILDIETPSNSGITIARMIRKVDTKSIIIFITGYEQHGYRLLKSRLNFLTFISKYDDYESILYDTLNDAINYSENYDYIEFIDKGVKYKIRQDKVLYITRSTYERKTIIVTDNNEYKVYKSLNEFLNNNFIRTHRSCLVNKKRVESLNYNKNIITFDNGKKIDLLSKKYKGDLRWISQ